MWHHRQKYNLNQQGGDAIHKVIVIECDKYKPATIFEQVNKFHEVNLLKMMLKKNIQH